MTPDARSHLRIGTAALAGLCYLSLTVLVATGVTQPLDDSLRQRFRPDDVWGTAQVRTGPLIDGLEPQRLFALLTAVALVLALARLSWRPLAFAGFLAGSASVVTLATKHALQRSDPHAEVFGGGSYPSGHILSELICLGGVVLLLQRRSRWWAWAPVVGVGIAMALALLFAAAHWFTDIVGGALLAATLLPLAAALPLRSAAAGPPPRPRRDGSGMRGPVPRGARRPPAASRTTR